LKRNASNVVDIKCHATINTQYSATCIFHMENLDKLDAETKARNRLQRRYTQWGKI